MSMSNVKKLDSWQHVPGEQFEKVSRRRLKSIKSIFQGGKSIIFTCGPSLKKITKAQISELIKKKFIIICVKQAINYMPDKFCHFHVVNFCNEKRYIYDSGCVPIRLYCQRSERRIIPKKGYDIVVSHFPNNLKDNIITAIVKGEDQISFDNLLQRKNLKVKWGDTMYELAIPLALFIGSSRIFIIGWDCKNFKKHFYGNDSRPQRNNTRQKLDKLQVLGGKHIHKFLKKKFKTVINLVGDGDESIFSIPYISIDKLLLI